MRRASPAEWGVGCAESRPLRPAAAREVPHWCKQTMQCFFFDLSMRSRLPSLCWLTLHMEVGFGA